MILYRFVRQVLYISSKVSSSNNFSKEVSKRKLEIISDYRLELTIANGGN